MPIPAALVLLIATVVQAQEKLLRAPFGRLDRNKDGGIAKVEFPGNPALFAAMDKNKDGEVVFDEYKVSGLARRYLAALRIDRSEPRQRVSPADLASKRLQFLSRFDKNRDGRITRSEWTGAPGAFTSMDFDGNGIIDKKDRIKAKAESKVLAASQAKLPDLRTKLPNGESALKYYDKNKDGQLSAKEAAKSPLDKVFRYADVNGDKQLERREIDYVAARVNAAIAQRNLGYARPRAPSIPFRAWDKNDDGRVDLKEWVEKKYLFKLIDLNRDGAVTKTEVLRFKRAFEGDNFLERFDLNEDGKVTRKEFGGSKAAFDRADRNGDGVISNRDR